MQKIDMGIALCHFMSVTGGNLAISDPDTAVDGNEIWNISTVFWHDNAP